jgi:hypothetical protein
MSDSLLVDAVMIRTDSTFCPHYHRAVELVGRRWTGVLRAPPRSPDLPAAPQGAGAHLRPPRRRRPTPTAVTGAAQGAFHSGHSMRWTTKIQMIRPPARNGDGTKGWPLFDVVASSLPIMTCPSP